MTQCQVCERKSDLFLCASCTNKLRDALNELPGWLTHLREASVGQVRLGDGGRGSTRREPFHGDDEALTACACGHPEHFDRACGYEITNEINFPEGVDTSTQRGVD
jgi:hypothetical protein